MNGDDETDLAGTITCSTLADQTSPIGSYPISCAGATSTNYTITYVAGTLSVTAATLIAHPTVDNKAFDGNTTANVSGGTLEGVLNGDSVSLDVSGALANFDTPEVGTSKPVHVTGLALTGTGAGNYVLASTEADTTADIGSAVLTVTADDQTKAYGVGEPGVDVPDHRLRER